MSDEVDGSERRSDEALEVLRRRYTEARKAGFSIAEAQLFRDDPEADIGLLRKCVAGDCPLELRRKILL